MDRAANRHSPVPETNNQPTAPGLHGPRVRHA